MKTLLLLISITVSFFVLSTGSVFAKVEWIELEIDTGETVRALHGYPENEGKHPAVIYNHGTIVRKLGYAEASRKGYNVKEFVEALVKGNFVVLAPIRERGRLEVSPRGKPNIMGGTTREGSDAIKEGVAVSESGLKFLKEKPNVDVNRLGIVGFSEGGLISLWSAFDRTDLNVIVLMSPANIGRSDKFKFKKAVKQLERINAPVLVTLGRSDIKKIIKNCTNRFIPRMKELNKEIDYKIDYSGNHKWFHKVRSEYWKDVIKFLNTHLM